MNFVAMLLKGLSAIPSIVSGIEAIHKDAKDGASKKQMALEALGLADGASQFFLPQYKDAIDSASALAAQTIDGVVKLYNATQWPSSGTPALAPSVATKK